MHSFLSKKKSATDLLDLISRGAQVHGLVHLLLTSAAELGFAVDGEEKGWVGASLPALRMMTGPT